MLLAVYKDKKYKTINVPLSMKDEIKNNPDGHPTFQKGYKHTQEAREKMRQGQLNSDYVKTEEHKKKDIAMKKRKRRKNLIFYGLSIVVLQ